MKDGEDMKKFLLMICMCFLLVGCGNYNSSSAAKDLEKKINDTKNSIMIAENLLSTKGFENNVIFVNGDSISVIIGKEELSQDEIAQIQNIISRELNAQVENIHISKK